MKSLAKVFGVLSLIALVFKLAIDGYISPATAAILLIIGVVLQIFSENFAKLIISIAGFVIFVWALSNGKLHDFNSILIAFIPLFIGLFGFYIMLKPLISIFSPKENNPK